MKSEFTIFVIGFAFVCEAAFVARADSGRADWVSVQAMYHINAADSHEDVVPEAHSVARPVYDALRSIPDRDAVVLRRAFMTDDREIVAGFVRRWEPRVSDWSLNLYDCGEDADRGWGYVVVRSHRTLGASLLHDIQGSPPFVDVVFLTRTAGRWRITDRDLDPEWKRQFLAREERALGHRMMGAEEWRDAELQRMSAAYISGRRVWGAYDPDTDPEFEEKFKEWLEYQQGVRKRPPRANSLEELMEIHGGHLIDPPISFMITEEPQELSFETPLHGVQMAFYMVTLSHLSGGLTWEYPFRREWKRKSISDMEGYIDLEGRVLPQIMDFNRSRLGRVQLLAYLPVSRNDDEYCVFYYRVLQTDELRFPLSESVTSWVRESYERAWSTEALLMGRLILEYENEKWLPVRSIPYVSLMDGGQTRYLLIGGGTTGQVHRMEQALEYLRESNLPDHFQHIHTDDECMPLSEAIKLNILGGE